MVEGQLNWIPFWPQLVERLHKHVPGPKTRGVGPANERQV